MDNPGSTVKTSNEQISPSDSTNTGTSQLKERRVKLGRPKGSGSGKSTKKNVSASVGSSTGTLSKAAAPKSDQKKKEKVIQEDESDDIKTKDKKLVFLSRSVLQKVRERPMVTGTQIANEILEMYKNFVDIGQKVDFKNV